MQRIHLLSLSLLVPLMILGCTSSGLLGSNFNIISRSEEKQLGSQLSSQISKENQELKDQAIAGYVQAVGQRLVSASMNPGEPYVFHVLADPSVNAFAIPGGHLYVNSGLILAAENEAELAAVLGHELGHAENRHTTESMSRAMGVQIIAGMILGKEPGAMKQAAAGLVANGGLSAYSRGAEREADSYAVFVLNRAGYDPNAITTFFEKLLALEEQQGSSHGIGMSLFSSHPETVERIQNTKAEINSFGNNRSNAKEIIGGFAQIQAKVKNATAAPQK